MRPCSANGTMVSHDFFFFVRTNPQLAGNFITFHKESGNKFNGNGAA